MASTESDIVTFSFNLKALRSPELEVRSPAELEFTGGSEAPTSFLLVRSISLRLLVSKILPVRTSIVLLPVTFLVLNSRVTEFAALRTGRGVGMLRVEFREP